MIPFRTLNVWGYCKNTASRFENEWAGSKWVRLEVRECRWSKYIGLPGFIRLEKKRILLGCVSALLFFFPSLLSLFFVRAFFGGANWITIEKGLFFYQIETAAWQHAVQKQSLRRYIYIRVDNLHKMHRRNLGKTGRGSSQETRYANASA